MAPALDTREALLKATAELLSEVGYAEMTTASVARRAGVAEGTIYRHFPSKDALTEAVFQQAWDHLCAATEAGLPPRDQPAARLRAFGPVGFYVFAKQPVDAAICNQEHMYWINTCGLHTLPPGPQRFVDLLEESIRLAQASGDARPNLDARLTAAFLFHGVGHLMERFARPAPDGRPAAYEPEAFRAALDAILEPALFPEQK